jgi:predicted PurR-regulated permease PerM
MRDAERDPSLLVGGACLVVILAGLRAASEVLVPLAFSAFLAVLSTPLVFWLRRRRVPVVVAVVFVVLVVIAVLTGLAVLVGGSVNSLVSAAPRYQQRVDTLLSAAIAWLEARDIELSAAGLREIMDPSAAIGLLGGTVSQLATMLSNTLLVILTVVFMLFEITVLPTKLHGALGEESAHLERYAKIVTEINEYIVIKTYVSLAAGAVAWLMLWALGVDFALLWGFITFVLHFVPNIGAIVASIPPVLLALVQFGVGRALIAMFGFVAIGTVIGNIIEPRVMGRRLGLSTLVVFLSLLVWGWVWGPMGMLLSVPLTMILKIFFENSRDLRWIAVLMDGEIPKPPPPAAAGDPP